MGGLERTPNGVRLRSAGLSKLRSDASAERVRRAFCPCHDPIQPDSLLQGVGQLIRRVRVLGSTSALDLDVLEPRLSEHRCQFVIGVETQML
jgi:hypothetical protein